MIFYQRKFWKAYTLGGVAQRTFHFDYAIVTAPTPAVFVGEQKRFRFPVLITHTDFYQTGMIQRFISATGALYLPAELDFDITECERAIAYRSHDMLDSA